jgi:hypothetical protein
MFIMGIEMPKSDYDLEIYLAAGNANTALPSLCCFLLHNDSRIRSRVAENPRLPAAYLADLAGDRSPLVRIAVADNLNTPIDVLKLLAQDSQPDVRYSIAENSNTPVPILEMLMDDEHPYVVSRARKTLSRLKCETYFIRHCA